MADWTFAVSRLGREGEEMPWSQTMANLQGPMAGPAGLFGLAFAAFFRWTWFTLALGVSMGGTLPLRHTTGYVGLGRDMDIFKSLPPLPWPFVPHVAGE